MSQRNQSGKGTFARGIHPPGHKALSAGAAITVIPTPAKLVIPLQQHIGAPSVSIVKMRQEVAMGELIGESGGFISASLHAPLAGTIGKECATTLPTGRRVAAIPLKVAAEQLEGAELLRDILGGEWPTGHLDQYEPAVITEAVRMAGIVGQGGAAFPTSVKIERNEQKPVDSVLVNGCECEPYLTADQRLMEEFPAPVISGALLAARACGASRVVIAVEDNKPAAAEALRKAAHGTPVEIRVVKTIYPMGGEKQTVHAVLGRTIPAGGLPLDIGVVVINVGTATAVARSVLRDKPLTHRIVTVTGGGINQPANVLAPIGISFQELITFCGGLNEDAARVVAGGPMMGFAIGDLNIPVTKGTSGILVMTHDEVRKAEETACVRCGRCVDVCPLNLVPTKLAMSARHSDWDMAKRYHITDCMECGSCAYSCPAAIPLVQLIRMGKTRMPK